MYSKLLALDLDYIKGSQTLNKSDCISPDQMHIQSVEQPINKGGSIAYKTLQAWGLDYWRFLRVRLDKVSNSVIFQNNGFSFFEIRLFQILCLVTKVDKRI